MNSQNRMNAGAEYVLYRIWATLQDREGIHAESLLACVGALAGYACQASVRRSGAPADLLLTTSPMSVWALIRRSLQKLGKPLPDIEDISAHVARTLGTSEFGIPRAAADGHRPRLLPIVYLTQLWPQVLPIAQRFCRRPAQLPVLFGIALQRAIEHTTERVNPTLGASIAMECAVAMARATLPATLSDLFHAGPAVPELAAAPVAPGITFTPQRAAQASSPASNERRATKRKRSGGIDPKMLEVGFFSTRMRSAKVIATIMSLAIVAVTSAAWKNDRREDAPVTARVATKLNVRTFRAGNSPFEQPTQSDQAAQQALVNNETPSAQETPPMQATPPAAPADEDLPAPAPDQGEGVIAEDWQSA